MTDVLVFEKGTGRVSPVADGRGPRTHTHSRDRWIVSADIPTAGRELGNRLMYQLSDGRSIGAPVRSIICGPCCLPTAAVPYSAYLKTHIPIGKSTMAKIKVQGYRCERCLHEWVPRRSSTTEPRTCPKCKSPYWDTPRRVVKK